MSTTAKKPQVVVAGEDSCVLAQEAAGQEAALRKKHISELAGGSEKDGQSKPANRRSRQDRLPEGVIRFPHAVVRGEGYDCQEIDEVRRRFNVGDMMLMNATAFEAGGKAVVITGPPGVGKSTLVRQLAEENEVKLMDDGYVLIGFDKDTEQPKVIDTGLYDMGKRKGVTLAMHRLFRRSSPYVSYRGDETDSDEFERGIRRLSFSTKMARLAGKAISSVIRSPTPETFNPREVELSDVICCTHERDGSKPQMITGDDKVSVLGPDEVKSKLSGSRVHEFALPDTQIRDKMLERLRDITQRLTSSEKTR